MKKVLLASPYLVYGGAEKQFCKLLSVLCTQNYEVHLAVLSSLPEDLDKGSYFASKGVIVKHFSCSPMESSWLKTLFVTFKVIAYLFKTKPSIYYSFSLYFFAVYLSGLFVKTRMIYSERILSNATKKRSFYYKVLAKVSEIVVNSKSLRDFFINEVGAHNVSLIPNYIEAIEYKKSREVSGPFKVAVISRLSIEKNIHFVINALDKYFDERIELSLFYTAENIEYSKFLNEYKSGNVKVIFFGKEKLEKIYEKNDCIVHASTAEGLPNVVVEAMLSKMPIFCSSIRENLDTGISEFFSFPLEDDGKELVRKLSYWRNLSDSERLTMLDENYYSAANKFSYERFYNNLSMLFEFESINKN